MKYIVTGAAGLIGSAIVHALNKRGETDILAVDHLGSTTEKWKNLRALHFTDYMEKEDFFAMLKEPGAISVGTEAIIHMGACSSTTETDASYLVRNNYECTKVLASLAVDQGIRFLYASSAATYGDGSCGYSDDESEIERLRPLNMYGYSKQMFDLWAKRNGMLKQITGVKFTNVYGPNERHKGSMRSMVCRAYEQIRDTGKVRLFRSDRPDYGDGEQKRDFLYVKDAADMVLFLLGDPRLCGLYNVGSGKAETWNELAKAVFDAMGKPVDIEYIDMPDHLKGKYQYYTCADMSKMKAAGYPGKVRTLHEAIEDDVVRYLLPGKYLGDWTA